MSSTQYEVDDVVSLRTPFFQGGGWRVIKIFPSLQHGVMLHRVQLLDDNGTEKLKIKPISVGTDFIKQKLGRFPTWQQQIGSKN